MLNASTSNTTPFQISTRQIIARVDQPLLSRLLELSYTTYSGRFHFETFQDISQFKFHIIVDSVRIENVYMNKITFVFVSNYASYSSAQLE